MSRYSVFRPKGTKQISPRQRPGFANRRPSFDVALFRILPQRGQTNARPLNDPLQISEQSAAIVLVEYNIPTGVATCHYMVDSVFIFDTKSS
jgi:hypothetical protein